MKKILIALLIIITVVVAGVVVFYKFYLPDLVAEALVSEEAPAYLPPSVSAKMEKLKKPLNKTADRIVQQMHESNVPVEKVIETIDKTSEEDINEFIAEVRSTEITSTDQVFDIGKKYIDADFNIEAFRETFKKHVSFSDIERAMNYENNTAEMIDVTMAKEVMKKLILEKDRQVSGNK